MFQVSKVLVDSACTRIHRTQAKTRRSQTQSYISGHVYPDLRSSHFFLRQNAKVANIRQHVLTMISEWSGITLVKFKTDGNRVNLHPGLLVGHDSIDQIETAGFAVP